MTAAFDRLVRPLVTALALVLVIGLAGPPASADAATRVSGSPLQLLGRLATASEHPRGYDRAKFIHWTDADGDGCDTRDEVLIKESLVAVRVGRGCAIYGGRWYSAYDGRYTRDPGTFDIDHVVALKEAWDSGAWNWTKARRRAFANDLGDKRSLRAVTAGSNRSKSDQDPADWLPTKAGFRCTYARQWVAVKVRWRLKVNTAERTALRRPARALFHRADDGDDRPVGRRAGAVAGRMSPAPAARLAHADVGDRHGGGGAASWR